MLQKSFTITSDTGLRARPSTYIIQTASSYHSHIEIEYNNRKANLKSIMGVMALAIPKDGHFTIYLTGSDEKEALKGIEKALIDHNLIDTAEKTSN